MVESFVYHPDLLRSAAFPSFEIPSSQVQARPPPRKRRRVAQEDPSPSPPVEESERTKPKRIVLMNDSTT